MQKFMINACLLGGAILIWLSIIGGTIVAVAAVSYYNDTAKASLYTDSNGNQCGIEDTKVDPNTFDLVCP